MFLGEVFYYLPRVIMYAIILVAAYGLIELEDLAFMWKMKAWRDLAVMTLTFVITLFISVDLGILAGLGVSILLLIKNTTTAHLSLMGVIPGTTKYKELDKYPEAKRLENILIVSVNDALFFSNIQKVKDMIARIERLGSHTLHPGEDRIDFKLKGVVIFAKNISDIDCSALQILHEMSESYHHRNVQMCFAKLPEKLISVFKTAGIIHAGNDHTTFDTIHEAVEYINSVEDTQTGNNSHAAQGIQFSESALGHRSTNARKDLLKNPLQKKSKYQMQEDIEGGTVETNGKHHEDKKDEEDPKDEEVGFEDTVR